MRDDYAIDRIAGATTFDSEGTKVGTAGRVFADTEDGDPTFVAVNTGLFGMSESIVPLAGARMKGDDLHLEYTKEQIDDAPRVDEDGDLSESDEGRLYSHFGLPEPEGAGQPGDTGETPAEAQTETAQPGADTEGESSDAPRSTRLREHRVEK